MKLKTAATSIALIAVLMMTSFIALALSPSRTSGHRIVSPYATGGNIEQKLQLESNNIALDAINVSAAQARQGAVMSAVSILTLAAAIAAALYARSATGQARRSADIAASSLIASERAWLTTEVQILDDFRVNPISIDVGVGILIKNIGKTPALNVHTYVDMIKDHMTAAEKVDQLCEDNRISNRTSSRTLLPGDSYIREWRASADITGEESFYLPVVVGVVTYETLPDHQLHQTAFSAMLSRRDDGEGSGLFWPSANVKKNEILATGYNGAKAD